MIEVTDLTDYHSKFEFFSIKTWRAASRSTVIHTARSVFHDTYGYVSRLCGELHLFRMILVIVLIRVGCCLNCNKMLPMYWFDSSRQPCLHASWRPRPFLQYFIFVNHVDLNCHVFKSPYFSPARVHRTNAFHSIHSGLLEVAESILICDLHHARLFHCSILKRRKSSAFWIFPLDSQARLKKSRCQYFHWMFQHGST